MTEINIPHMHINEIEKLIHDDAIKRAFGYESVDDFIIHNIELNINANKDAVGIPLD